MAFWYGSKEVLLERQEALSGGPAKVLQCVPTERPVTAREILVNIASSGWHNPDIKVVEDSLKTLVDLGLVKRRNTGQSLRKFQRVDLSQVIKHKPDQAPVRDVTEEYRRVNGIAVAEEHPVVEPAVVEQQPPTPGLSVGEKEADPFSRLAVLTRQLKDIATELEEIAMLVHESGEAKEKLARMRELLR